MRLKNYLFMGALSALAFTSCMTNDDKSEWNDGSRPISFDASIKGAVRAADNQWTAGDKAGVFMKAAGGSLSAPIAANKQHTADAAGMLMASTPENELYYPTNGSAVDFVAYYPYTASLTGTTYAVNVADQSNQPAIDLLYSNNAGGFAKGTSGKPQLQFAHILSQIVFNITKDATVPSLDGLAVTFKGMNTKADFALGTGTLSNEGTVADVAAKVTSTTATAIVLPAAALSNVEVVFTLNGKTFKAPYPQAKLENGHKYTHQVKLSDKNGQVVIEMNAATITNWTEVSGGNINVDFSGGEPGGGDPGTTPGEAVTLINETFGTPEKNGNYWPSVDIYKGWDSKAPIVFSDPLMTGSYSQASARTTKSLNGHIWFAAKKDCALKISGFESSKVKTLKLTYDIAAHKAGNQNVIVIKTDKGDLTVPDKAISKENVYQAVELSVPDGITYIQFTGATATNTVGYRIDNIKLTGVGK